MDATGNKPNIFYTKFIENFFMQKINFGMGASVFAPKGKLVMAVVGTALALASGMASATTVFNGRIGDGDIYHIELTLAGNPGDASYTGISHTNATNPSLVSPGYTFTGQLITGVSGWFIDVAYPAVKNPITGLLAPGSIVENVSEEINSVSPPTPDFNQDTIAHSLTDNLYNVVSSAPGFAAPYGSFNSPVSFGGFAFSVDISALGGNLLTKDYQLFTASQNMTDVTGAIIKPGDLAGCPGSCVKATTIPELDTTTGTLPAAILVGMMGLASERRRRQKANA
jgi:hypothetical protein